MPTRPAAHLRLGLAGAAVLVVALGAPTALAADRDVAIRDFAFSPGSTQVRVGDSVAWTNRDQAAHTATAGNGAFDTGLLEEGDSRSIRFTVAGTYRYICTPHPNMTGTVVVRAVATGVRPPETDMAPTIPSADRPIDRSPLVALVALGGSAYVLVWRSIR